MKSFLFLIFLLITLSNCKDRYIPKVTEKANILMSLSGSMPIIKLGENLNIQIKFNRPLNTESNKNFDVNKVKDLQVFIESLRFNPSRTGYKFESKQIFTNSQSVDKFSVNKITDLQSLDFTANCNFTDTGYYYLRTDICQLVAETSQGDLSCSILYKFNVYNNHKDKMLALYPEVAEEFKALEDRGIGIYFFKVVK